MCVHLILALTRRIIKQVTGLCSQVFMSVHTIIFNDIYKNTLCILYFAGNKLFLRVTIYVYSNLNMF